MNPNRAGRTPETTGTNAGQAAPRGDSAAIKLEDAPLYVYLIDGYTGPVITTEVRDGLMFDTTPDNRLVGIEVLDYARLAIDGVTVTRPEPDLDAAWKEAEAALPDGWQIAGLTPVLPRGSTPYQPVGKIVGWRAGALAPAWSRDAPEATGPTPAAALLSLARQLQALSHDS